MASIMVNHINILLMIRFLNTIENKLSNAHMEIREGKNLVVRSMIFFMKLVVVGRCV